MYNEKQWQFIFELFCRGYSLVSLSDWLGISVMTIQRTFKKMGFRAADQAKHEPLIKYTEYFNNLI